MDLCNDRLETSPQRRRGFRLTWPDDWRAFLHTRANILVTGPDAALKAFLRAARPVFRGPVGSVADGRMHLLRTVNTLIVHEADTLNRAAQRVLLAWLDEPEHADMQVVSTASAPLFPLVRAKGFDEDLYYRLNTIWLEVRGLSGEESDEVQGARQTA